MSRQVCVCVWGGGHVSLFACWFDGPRMLRAFYLMLVGGTGFLAIPLSLGSFYPRHGAVSGGGGP